MFMFTEKELAAAFTEWQRQYQEDPTAFMTREASDNAEPVTYGQSAAKTLIRMLQF